MPQLEPILVFCTALCIASAWTVANKALFQTASVGVDGGEEELFLKPLFLALLCFAGQALLLPVFYASQVLQRSSKGQAEERQDNDDDDNVLEAGDETLPPPPPLSSSLALPNPLDLSLIRKIIVAATCDIVGTTLGIVSLRFIPGSLNAVLASFGICWVVAFKLLLGEKLAPLRLVGVGLVLVSSAMTCLPSLFDGTLGSFSTVDTAVGIALALAGSLICSAYMVFAEGLFDDQGDESKGATTTIAIDPTFFAGWTGAYGTLLLSIVVSVDACGLALDGYSSAARGTCAGDWLDLGAMVANSMQLLGLLLAYLVLSCLWGWAEAAGLSKLNAVYCNLIFPFRGLLVWISSLVIFYGGDLHSLGENWSRLSPLFVAMLPVLTAGIVFYTLPERSERVIGRSVTACCDMRSERVVEETAGVEIAV